MIPWYEFPLTCSVKLQNLIVILLGILLIQQVLNSFRRKRPTEVSMVPIQSTPPITWRNLIITFLPVLLPPLIEWIMSKLREDEEKESAKS